MIIDGQNVDDLPQVLNYNGDGTLNYVQITTVAIPSAYAGGTYRKTYTYTSGKVTAVSDWIKQ